MLNNFVVYRIKNNANGRVYFGSSDNFGRRERQHRKSIEECSGPSHLMRLDIERNGYTNRDFLFRIVARFDNQNAMLEREQALINMYWGTANSYNGSHEVKSGTIKKTLVAWNMRTLETRNYLSCHAISKDLGIKKNIIRQILNGEILNFNSWIAERWSKRRSVLEVKEIYRRCGIAIPEDSTGPRRQRYPVPGVCSIADLVYRERYFAPLGWEAGRRLCMAPNKHQIPT